MTSVFVHMSEISPSRVWTHEWEHACMCVRGLDHGSLSHIHARIGVIMPTPMCAHNSVGALMLTRTYPHMRNHAGVYAHT
jgi:hypothetical protein